MAKTTSYSKSSAPSQRQLRVGEELRHALSDIFMRGDYHIPELQGVSVTVSEVRVPPDLKHANAYVTTLGGAGAEEAVKLLNEHAQEFRHEMTSRVHLKFSPKLRFKLDTSFDEAQRIENLLKAPEVQKDIQKN
jgi:ribosome-binding factor A